jgi:integrase/recombinase XerD
MARLASFSSALAPSLHDYVDLKRALGRRFDNTAWTLMSLDRFLVARRLPDLNLLAFQDWCRTHDSAASGVRRARMFDVRNFCLYRRRTEPRCFVPDPSTFPPQHQRLIPRIFSEIDVARLLSAAAAMKRHGLAPLRPEIIRLSVVLLFTTGIRRGELVNLTLSDYDRTECRLRIRETKFFKSRLLPINASIASEVERYLSARSRRLLPTAPNSKFLWNGRLGDQSYTGAGLQHSLQPLLEQCGLRTVAGRLPRLHDFRHSFAVNALLRWYRAGIDVGAKLPLLAAYMGHGSAISTHYYLQFVEPLRKAAGEHFAHHYGALVSPPAASERHRR